MCTHTLFVPISLAHYGIPPNPPRPPTAQLPPLSDPTPNLKQIHSLPRPFSPGAAHRPPPSPLSTVSLPDLIRIIPHSLAMPRLPPKTHLAPLPRRHHLSAYSSPRPRPSLLPLARFPDKFVGGHPGSRTPLLGTLLGDQIHPSTTHAIGDRIPYRMIALNMHSNSGKVYSTRRRRRSR